MENEPKYFRFDRRVIGIMDTAKKVIESTAIGTAGGSVVIGFPEGGYLTMLLIVVRATLSFVISRSDIKNPLPLTK